jgi:hypothetical protein
MPVGWLVGSGFKKNAVEISLPAIPKFNENISNVNTEEAIESVEYHSIPPSKVTKIAPDLEATNAMLASTIEIVCGGIVEVTVVVLIESKTFIVVQVLPPSIVRATKLFDPTIIPTNSLI